MSLSTTIIAEQDMISNVLNTDGSKNHSKNFSILSSGIVNKIEPPLKEVRNQLAEIETKQQDLVQKLHTENLNISEVQHSDELQTMFINMKLYHSKLQLLKKNIKVLHDRSTKLKKRAMKLQQIKEKEPVEEIIISVPSSSVIGTSDSSS